MKIIKDVHVIANCYCFYIIEKNSAVYLHNCAIIQYTKNKACNTIILIQNIVFLSPSDPAELCT